MNLDCEQCGTSSPAGSEACVQCSASYAFLSQPSSEWSPDQFSAWLFSEHFQLCNLVAASGIDRLSRDQQLNYLVGYLYYQVANGGVWQYFGNPCGPDAPLLVAVLRDIQAGNLADAIEQCLNFFPDRQPQLCTEERDESIESIPEDIAGEIHEKITGIIFEKSDQPDLLVLLRKSIEATRGGRN